MTTFMSGMAAEMRRVASMPSSSGICTSMSTRSGCSSRVSVTASRPFFASPTTS
jgi:hypothetical protein